MRVGIIGAGVVGKATGIGLGMRGHESIFYDIEEKVRKKLREEGHRVVDSNKELVYQSDVLMICVPTPSANGRLDTSHVWTVAKEIKPHLDSQVVVLRSTVIPGTTRALSSTIPGERLVYNPEFLREAYALQDFSSPDRIVIGSNSPNTLQFMRDLYHGFDAPILEVDWETAELAKLASNAFLATKISFFNEVWLLCQRMKIDSAKVSEIVALDHRIGFYGTQGGRAFGGKCLPKDLQALIAFSKSIGENPKLLEAVMQIQARMERQ
jgi:UDPglucose 6-dehydrogenase